MHDEKQRGLPDTRVSRHSTARCSPLLTAAAASRYVLRRSASHGVAQGVLAAPSVLAALAAAAPTGGGWQPALRGSCCAALTRTVSVVYGNPAKVLTREEHLAKFRTNLAFADGPIPAANADALIALVDDLEALDDARRLVDLVTAG